MNIWKPIYPSEYEFFYDNWCMKCLHDKEFRETGHNGCPILGLSMNYPVDDDVYPRELRIKDGNPMCTNFSDEPIQYRCDKTVDMFGE